jgi:hypothetical protein
MAEAIYKTGNVVLVDKYAQKTALRLGVSTEATRTEFKKFSRVASRSNESTEDEPVEEKLSRPPHHEFWLLKLVLLHEELAGWINQHLDPAWIEHSMVRQVISAWLKVHSSKESSDTAGFLSQFEDLQVKSLISEALTENRAIPNPQQQLNDVLMRLRNQAIDRQLAALSQRVGVPELDDAARTDILVQQQQLRLAKRQPLTARS